jgi:hypothetical protein
MADGLGATTGPAPPEVNRLWQDLEDRTERLLRDHRDELTSLTDALLERSELNTGEVLEILGPNGHNGTGHDTNGKDAGRGPDSTPGLPEPPPPGLGLGTTD